MILFSSSIDIIEDLAKQDSDKYEYIFPNFEYTREAYLDDGIFETVSYSQVEIITNITLMLMK